MPGGTHAVSVIGGRCRSTGPDGPYCVRVDIGPYIVRHAREWDRLSELVNRPGLRRQRLTGEQVDELVELYQRVATQLTVIRSSHSDPVLEARLSSLVGQARGLITGAATPAWQLVGRFFTMVFPAAVYRARWSWIAVGVLSMALIAFFAWRVINVPDLAQTLVDPAKVKQLVEHDFADYYSQNPATDFAFEIWANNAKVTAAALIMGILILPLLVVLYSNMENTGVIAGYMISYGRSDVLFGLLLPHGMLELTCVFVAAGCGLRLAGAWIAPGPRSRGRAIAEEGRAVGAVALGLALVLGVSGLIEAFVTPSPLPTWARVTIGAIAWLAFMTYVFTLGRSAVRHGETGDIDPAERSAEVPAETG